MAFATINYFSRSLKKASSFNVVFPDDPTIPRPWAVFYLLHGLSDDHTIWMRRTSIERYVAGLPLVVVMPDGGRGWYTNAVEGYAYEDDLIKDVVGLVDRTFPVKAERAGPGDRRALDGGLRGGQARPEASRDVRQRQLALRRPRVRSAATPRRPRSSAPSSPRSSATTPKGGPEDPFAIVEKIDHGRIPADPDRLRDRRLPPRPEPRLPRAPGGAARPPRVPGVPRRPRLGLLGHATSSEADRVPRAGTCKLSGD